MIFSDGDFIVLGIVFLVLFLFRRLDKNSKSLEKVRRYAEKVKGELDKIFQDKEQQMKDLSINFQVQETTYREILKRVEEARSELENREEALTELMGRLQGFDQRINGLYQLTAKVDENMIRLRDESDYVDQLGLRMKDLKKAQEVLDQRMGNLRESFTQKNQEQLESVKLAMVDDVQARFELISGELTRGSEELNRFQVALKEYRLINDELTSQTVGRVRGELEQLEQDYQLHIQRAAEQGEILQQDVFQELQSKIEGKAKGLEDNWFQGMADLKDEVANRVQEIQGYIVQGDQGLSQLQENQQNLMEESTGRLKQLEGELASLEESMERVQDGVSEARSQVLEQLRSSQEELAQNMEQELSQHMDDLRHRLEHSSLETHQGLEEQIQQYQDEIAGKFSRFQSQWEDMQSQEQHVDEALVSLKQEMERIKQQALEVNQASVQNMEELMAQQLKESGLELDEKLLQWRESISQRLQDVEHEDSESLKELEERLVMESRESLQETKEKIYQDYNGLKSAADQMSQELLDKIEQSRGDMNTLESSFMDGIEKYRRETQEQIFNDYDELKLSVDQISDNIQRKVEGSQEDLQGLEKSFQADLENFQQDSRDHFSQLQSELLGFREQTNSDMEQVSSSLADVENRLESLKDSALSSAKERFGLLEETLQRDLDSLTEERRIELNSWQEDQQRKLEQMDQVYKDFLENLEQSVRDSAGEKVEAYREEVISRYETLSGKAGEYSEHIEGVLSQGDARLKEQQSQWTEEVEALREQSSSFSKSMNQSLEQLEDLKTQYALEIQGFEGGVQNQLDEMTRNVGEQIQEVMGRQEELKGNFTRDISDFQSELKITMDQLSSSAQEQIRQAMAQQDVLAKEMEQDVMGSIERRQQEYQEIINGRFDKLESISEDLDELDNSLRLTLSDQEQRLVQELEQFRINMKELQDKEQEENHQRLGDIRRIIGQVEGELNQLKTQAYENVSEKLQLFEDDFFSDLKSREEAMKDSFNQWQKSVDIQLEDLNNQKQREREELERDYQGQFKRKFNEIQARVLEQLNKFQEQVQGFQESVVQQIDDSEKDFMGFRQGVKDEINRLKETSWEKFGQEFAGHQESMDDLMARSDKEISMKLDNLSSDIEGNRNELNALINSSRSDIDQWQKRVLVQLKNQQAHIDNNLVDFRSQVDVTVEELKEDFLSQKEDIILKSTQDRAALRQELQQLNEMVEELSATMGSQSEKYISRLNEEGENFLLELQGRTRDVHGESEEKIRSIRQAIVDTRERMEALQNQLQLQVEDNYGALASNLEEMGRHQQEFIAQTHIFDQAETLKTNLERDIQELRGRMDTLDRSRQELTPMEEQYTRVLSTYQDVAGKMSQFFSEKQKIDLLDSKVARINSLSEAIDVKVEQIDGTNDMVQEFMVRIRQLEDLHNDIAKRYQGLEKKAGIVDATTNSVEKNLQVLGHIEKGLKSISEDLNPMKDDLAQIKMSNTALMEEKEKVDSLVGALTNLDQTMTDLEERQQRMEKAREWLASTETRLENIGREAQEKVKLLGTLVQKDGKKGVRQSGSPDMNTRDMVVQLARQGWNSEEISRYVKLSRGEVELILELAPPEE